MGNIITLLTVAVIYFIANQYINKKIDGQGGGALFEMDNQEGEDEIGEKTAQSIEPQYNRALFTTKSNKRKKVVNQPINTPPTPEKSEVKPVEAHISKPKEFSLKNPSNKELRKAVIMSEVLNRKF
ncbi:MAG: hypothetical protein SNJ33_05210 [Rikenellaceae bacterium]